MSRIKSSDLAEDDKRLLQEFFSRASEYVMGNINKALEDGLPLADLVRIIRLKHKSMSFDDLEAWREAISLEISILETIDGKRKA